MDNNGNDNRDYSRDFPAPPQSGTPYTDSSSRQMRPSPPPVPKFEASHIPPRKRRNLWKIGGLLALAGLVLTAAGWMNGGHGFSMYFDRTGVHVETPEEDAVGSVTSKSVELEPFNRVQINADFMDVFFIESDHYGIEISAPDNYKTDYSLDENSGELTIDVSGGDDNVRLYFFSVYEEASFINVFYPQGAVFESVDIVSRSGDIEAEFPTVKNVGLETGSGGIEGRFNSFTVIKAFAGSGDIVLENQSGEFLEANLSADSGDIEINEGSWGLIADVGSGSIEVNAGLMGKSEIHAGSGDVDVDTVPYQEQLLGYDLSSNTGSVEVNGEGDYGKRVKGNIESHNIVTIDSGSGDIELEIKE